MRRYVASYSFAGYKDIFGKRLYDESYSTKGIDFFPHMIFEKITFCSGVLIFDKN